MKILIIEILFLISSILLVVKAETTSRSCLCIRPCPTGFACLETNDRCSCIEVGIGRKRAIQNKISFKFLKS